MANVLNLNRARKRKRRDAERAQADANAVQFGRTKADRKVQAAQQALDDAKLDGVKRARDPSTESAPESPGAPGKDVP